MHGYRLGVTRISCDAPDCKTTFYFYNFSTKLPYRIPTVEEAKNHVLQADWSVRYGMHATYFLCFKCAL